MKQIKKMVMMLCVVVMVVSLTACQSKDNNKDGKVKLTFQIWDVVQKEGMEAIAKAYTEQNPNVTVEVQVTSWSEYWTKLEAAASGNQLPDIFWMHTNEILKYADNGMLADLTDLYKEESQTYYTDHFSEISLENIKGSDGKYYGIPKDKDTVCLIYNKEMFDQAEVSYPDENWTWNDYIDASKKIYEKTGKYGYMAYGDEQLGYWNFVYQARGYILGEDKKEVGFTNEATKNAMKFYIDLQKEEFCPDQNYFAETEPATAFFSEQGAMYLEGNWGLKSKLDDYPEMVGKWDVAVLPKCPNPASGDGRATMSNGLCYATAAKGKNLEAAKEFLRFLGSEEGQRIQGESGAAIPAYIGLESTWSDVFKNYEYQIAAQKCIDMFEYGVQSVNNASRPEWKTKVNDELLKIYANSVSFDEGIANMQKIVEDAIAKSEK